MENISIKTRFSNLLNFVYKSLSDQDYQIFWLTISLFDACYWFSCIIYSPWLIRNGYHSDIAAFYTAIGNLDIIQTLIIISGIISILFFIATIIAACYNNKKLTLIYNILWRTFSGIIILDILLLILAAIIYVLMPFIFYELPNWLFDKKEEKLYKIEENWHTKQVSYSEYMDYKLNETINGLSKFIKEK